MASPQAPAWKQLQTSSKAKHPDLFYSYVLSKGSILLQLTDLVILWQSGLTKTEIISEASRQHCSIDPAESADQLHVFLSKLEQSMATGRNLVANNDDSVVGSLLLRTQLYLPRPLRPFAFTFTLHLGQSSQFSGSVVQPLLRSLWAIQSQVTSLEDQIKAKDHVIAKLLDRIGTQAVDMSIIFPTLTGVGGRKGSVTVEMAKKKISGMEAFDHDAWLKEFDVESSNVEQVRVLLRGVERSNTLVEGHHDWTKQLPGPDVIERANASQDNTRASQSQSQSRNQNELEGDEATASEDDFERQATPPSLRKKVVSSNAARDDPDSAQTSGSEDCPPPSKKQKLGRIRGIGGRKPTATLKSPSESSSPPPRIDKHAAQSPRRPRSSSTDGIETASSSPESEAQRSVKTQLPHKPGFGGLHHKGKPSGSLSPHAERPSSPLPQNRPTSLHTPTASHRLGRLGKSRQRTATASPTPDKDPPSQPPTPSRRLGRIGMKKQTQSPIPEAVSTDSGTAGDEDEDLNGPATNPNSTKKMKASSPEKNPEPSSEHIKTPETNHNTPTLAPEAKSKPVETEDEKAARRKEELKKTIAAGPAKKKRRF